MDPAECLTRYRQTLVQTTSPGATQSRHDHSLSVLDNQWVRWVDAERSPVHDSVAAVLRLADGHSTGVPLERGDLRPNPGISDCTMAL